MYSTSPTFLLWEAKYIPLLVGLYKIAYLTLLTLIMRGFWMQLECGGAHWLCLHLPDHPKTMWKPIFFFLISSKFIVNQERLWNFGPPDHLSPCEIAIWKKCEHIVHPCTIRFKYSRSKKNRNDAKSHYNLHLNGKIHQQNIIVGLICIASNTMNPFALQYCL